jgi:hypothetical protein
MRGFEHGSQAFERSQHDASYTALSHWLAVSDKILGSCDVMNHSLAHSLTIATAIQPSVDHLKHEIEEKSAG